MTSNEVNVAKLLGLEDRVGLLATVAVVANVALELHDEKHMEEAKMLANRLLDKLRFDVCADEAVTDLWDALCDAVSTKDIQEAKRFQSVTQRAMAAHRKRVHETETELADFVEEVLSGPPPKQKDTVEKKAEVEAEVSWDEIVHERSREIGRMKKEIDLLAKKGTLLALLHRVTETNLATAMDAVTDNTQSEANESDVTDV